MSMPRELIVNVLTDRFRELCSHRFAKLIPAEFGEMSGFVARVRELYIDASAIESSEPSSSLTIANGWVQSDTDCLTALRQLALGEPLNLATSQQPSTIQFFEQLQSARTHPDQRFQLLANRYACPLNFAAPSEKNIREHLLERLMVQDRVRVEKGLLAGVHSNDLLLKLNLIAVYAPRSTDLRFLDALNYYYELLPANWRPHVQNNWLLVSYFALYARSLTAWSQEKDNECESASLQTPFRRH